MVTVANGYCWEGGVDTSVEFIAMEMEMVLVVNPIVRGIANEEKV